MTIQKDIIGENYSEVLTIGTKRYPTIGIVGLTHGDEIVGRKVLDKLQKELPPLLTDGQVKLIYANLLAEAAGKPFIDANLNRIFPGKKEGKLEEKIAYNLRDVLADCHFVLDIHSTTVDQGAFVISTVDSTQVKVTPAIRTLYKDSGLPLESRKPVMIDVLSHLATDTGLAQHVQMNYTVANGGSLIEFVNAHGKGYGLSFEAGQHQDHLSEKKAMDVVFNFLRARRMIAGNPYRQQQEVFLGQEFVRKPSQTFIPSPELRNFELLHAGTPYGSDRERKYSLEKDCYVVLFDLHMRDDSVFLRADFIGRFK